MKKNRVNMEHSKQQFRKIRKKTWFKPLCILLLTTSAVILVFFSARVAKISADKEVYLQEVHNKEIEKNGASDENAYDISYDDGSKTSRESGIMVTIGNLYDRITGNETEDHDVMITSESDTDNFSSGSSREIARMEQRITESVLSQIGTSTTEILEGAAGKDGEAGAPGERGEPGPRGAAGPAGKTGAAGKTGNTGATGEKGDTGESGMDGLSTFIVYADTEDGKNMSATPKESSKFIGTYQGTTRSSDPKDYIWTEYKDKIVTYTNDDGKPTIHIFN